MRLLIFHLRFHEVDQLVLREPPELADLKPFKFACVYQRVYCVAADAEKITGFFECVDCHFVSPGDYHKYNTLYLVCQPFW